MLTVTDLRGNPHPAREPLPRAGLDVAEALELVTPVVDDVRARGAAAVLDAGERFDGVRPLSLRVPTAVLEASLAGLDPAVRHALDRAIERVRAVHAIQTRSSETIEVAPGGTITQRWVPVDRVGLYVPGVARCTPAAS